MEITEAVLIRDDENALAVLHQLRDIGVRIALDDFGTGYLLAELSEALPVRQDQDRPLLHQGYRNRRLPAIVQAVVGIAKSSNMTTTAEGVETEQKKASLKRLGCTQMQGYLFSKPLRASDVRRLLGVGSEAALASA